ncbi:MAG TPA: condensation domain-containing protein, partial [Longimicrobiaceae bacterium]|nr:condensation domain-containing protein [Longimicrobiaceae bacterium]
MPGLVEDTYPLTPLQHAMLLHGQVAPGAGVDVTQAIYVLREALDPGLLAEAWRSVIRRHAALRTAVRWEGLDQPVQEVWSDATAEVAFRDWSALPEEERNARFRKYLHTDRHTDFDLRRPPLMRLALFRCAEAEYRLVWTHPHLILDGRSIHIVIREVFRGYEAAVRGEPVRLRDARPFREHVAWLREQDWSAAEPFWRRHLQGFAPPAPLATGHRSPVGARGGGYGLRSVRLSGETTALLRSVAEREGFTLYTLVEG